jgi:DNA-binding CsgD family transcriptional regulator/tetratricopeptide (TPR) repeat protein
MPEYLRAMEQSGVLAGVLERDRNLAELQLLVGKATLGQGSVAVIEGEAGIGKTTVLRAFSRLASRTTTVLWGGCEALFTPRTLGPLQDMAHRLSPVVGKLFDEGAGQDRLFPAVMRALDESRHPLVVIFEDVHWADNATLDLIKYLGRRLATLKVLLVLSVRRDEVTTDHPLSQVLGDLPSHGMSRIELVPLSAVAVEQMAVLAGKSGQGLFEITDGNPFFVSELLARGDAGDKLPRSLRDAVWARLSRLSIQERKLLELISIVPGAIEPWLIQSLVDDQADTIVDRCVSRGLLTRDSAGSLRFRHELARQATLERLSTAAQRDLHGKIDMALQAHDPDQKLVPFALRVHHANGAGDGAKVLALAPLAARRAAKMGAHREAARFLELALQHVALADMKLAAELHEEWSYEAGIAMQINDDIIAARSKAVAIWRELGRPDKVSLNLRWLSRLHWYRGESELAGKYISDAMAALEGQPPSAELAMVYSANSQMHMLRDHIDEAIDWGQRAIALADELGVVEIRIHALNNVGTSLLMSGREGGRAYMEESLALALSHGFHEHAARAYTNYAEHGVMAKDFALAERLIAEGIAFDTRHDLDAWTYYLIGRQAQLLMEQGKLREAETVARGVLNKEGQTLLMKLPALVVLATVMLRLGGHDASGLLHQALKDALATGEPQYVVPVRFALVEQAYIKGDSVQALEQLHAISSLNISGFDSWKRGELAVWWRRFGLEGEPDLQNLIVAAPRKFELDGEFEAAGQRWLELGLPCEAALSFMQGTGVQAARLIVDAVALLDGIGAAPLAAIARHKAAERGFAISPAKQKRGPYKAARAHPLGLTGRELEILGMIAQGMGNGDIARRLVRSQRTVEHHVSALLGKMNAQNRMDVVLRLRNEPWLLAEDQFKK